MGDVERLSREVDQAEIRQNEAGEVKIEEVEPRQMGIIEMLGNFMPLVRASGQNEIESLLREEYRERLISRYRELTISFNVASGGDVPVST